MGGRHVNPERNKEWKKDDMWRKEKRNSKTPFKPIPKASLDNFVIIVNIMRILVWALHRSLLRQLYIYIINWAVTWDVLPCGMCDQQRLRSACAYAQTNRSLCWSLGYSVNIKLLTEHHLEFLSLKRGCTGSSVSPLVKMPNCWKSRVTAQFVSNKVYIY